MYSEIEINFKTESIFLVVSNPLWSVSIFGRPLVHKSRLEAQIISSLVDDSAECAISTLEMIQAIAGYYAVVISLKRKSIDFVANDIFGNYRVYVRDESTKLKISDSIGTYNNDDALEIKHFERKSYTSVWGTPDKNIKKIALGEIIKIDYRSRTKKSVNRSKDPLRRIYDHLDMGESSYSKKVSSLISTNTEFGERKIILMFSGGIDSLFLAKMLIAKKRSFTAVFVKYEELNENNKHDEERSIKLSNLLGFDLDIILYSAKNNLQESMGIALSNQPIDYSYPAFYYALGEVKKRYGISTIINGQSSDSILCWGVSGTGISSIFQRLLLSKYTYSSNIFRKFIAPVASLVYRVRHQKSRDWYVPSNKAEFMNAVLCPSVYVPFYKKNDDVLSYLESQYAKFQYNNYNDFALAKNAYLQGSSNQLPIGASRAAGHELIMPYLDPKLLALVYNEKSQIRSLVFPRYELESVFSKAEMSILKIKSKKSTSSSSFAATAKKLKETWIQEVKI